MKKIDLGQTITILANVGVIAGIIFLALELQQNNELLASQARSNLLAGRVSTQLSVVENTGALADLISKAHRGEALTDTEDFRLRVYQSMIVHNFASFYQEVKSGPLAENDIPIQQWVGTFVNIPGLEEFWHRQTRLDPDFVRFVDEEVLPLTEGAAGSFGSQRRAE